MKLIKEAWDETEFDLGFISEEPEEEVIEFVEAPEIVDEIDPIKDTTILINDPLVAEVVSDSESPVEIKTTTTTSVEVLDSFTDVREEMARDIYNQFKENKLSVLDLNKRLAALCGSYEAGMKWLEDHEDKEVTKIEIITEPTVEDNEELKESLNEDIDDPYYTITYETSSGSGIYSVVVVKASSEEEAKEIFSKRKPDYVDAVIGVRHITSDEAAGLLKRGMSLLENKSISESLTKDNEKFESKEDALAYLKEQSKDPEKASFIKAILQLMADANSKEEILKEATDVDEIEIKVEPSEKEEKSEAEEIAETPNPPKIGLDTYVANTLNTLLVGELDTVNDYNNFIETLISNNTNLEILNVIKDIVAEEQTHIAQLQQCLKQVSPNAINFEVGQTEAAKQIASPVNVGDPSVDGKAPTETELDKDSLLSSEEAEEKENG